MAFFSENIAPFYCLHDELTEAYIVLQIAHCAMVKKVIGVQITLVPKKMERKFDSTPSLCKFDTLFRLVIFTTI